MAAKTLNGRTSHDVLWDACRAKACCRRTRVTVTGTDLSRLVEAFELDATEIVAPVKTDPGDRCGFQLAPGGPTHELALRKRGRIGAQGAPCVFLVETADGHAFCGAGSIRPTTCQAFPAVELDGAVRVLTGACSCRHWSPLDVGEPERAAARRAASEVERHAETIAEWNRELSSERTFAELCDYLTAAAKQSDG